MLDSLDAAKAMRRSRNVCAFAFFVVFLLLPSTASAQDARLGLSRSHQVAAVAGSYLGIAGFCKAYGVDFSELAGRIEEAMMRPGFFADPGDNFLFSRALAAGRLGALYSPQADQFLDMPKLGADMRQVCAAAHQQVVAISRMK